MDLTKIENLIEKYFEGTTSLKEENVLHTYFSQAFVPAHLQEYQALFAYFSKNKAEVSTQPIQVKTKKKTWQLYMLSYTAAAAILLFSVFWFTQPKGLTNAEREEAQLALIETQKVFQLISQNLNKGNNAIAYLQDYEEVKNKIFIKKE